MKALWIGLLAPALLITACGPGNPSDDDDDMTTIPCSEETRDDDYVAGLLKTGLNNNLETTLDSADPAPPDQGNNVWEVTVREVGGAEMQGCTIDVTPFMPDHGHGTSPQPLVAAGTDTGTYDITQINLFMGGLWEITLDIDCSGTTDTVVYRFCVES